MIFKRKIYSKLLDWKNKSNGSTALLIEGARRIGKSTIVEEFAKNEYETYLIIDFSNATEDVKSYFIDYRNDLDTLFLLLSTIYRVNLKPRKSLIIFDEIQFCPKARESIKTLVKDGRFDYIETGSLISVKENIKDILIPSEEKHIKMFPLDFEEFLWALNETQLSSMIKQFFTEQKPLPRQLHDKAMILFRQYLLIGGMPKVVSEYLENNRSFEKADEEKRIILDLYRADINKIPTTIKNKVTAIFDQIPGLLSRHEKRVILKDLGEGNRFEKYEDTFFWLADSQIANECFLCNDPNVGLSLNEERSYIKCYMGDTGLLVSHAFDESELDINNLYTEILTGDLSINNGMLFENAIAQSLVSNNNKLYFYTHYSEEKHRNDIEVDFIISKGSKLDIKINPIEVKSGRNYRTTSLNKFIERFKDRIGTAYIIHPKNLVIKENGIVCIPSYMCFCL